MTPFVTELLFPLCYFTLSHLLYIFTSHFYITLSHSPQSHDPIPSPDPLLSSNSCLLICYYYQCSPTLTLLSHSLGTFLMYIFHSHITHPLQNILSWCLLIPITNGLLIYVYKPSCNYSPASSWILLSYRSLTPGILLTLSLLLD